ncbi:hypothetical protein BSLG_010832 [Batrachochytrium salamandrivorans]|nr:hypothetical protein BSLG_010832 [Batrachochytrium salamandrivorans]
MVDISFVLVLALVSSTVVIPLNGKIPTPTSDKDPVDIGLSYILQQLNIQPDEFKRRTNFTDSFGVTHLYGMPLHKGSLIENLHAAVHIKGNQVVFYSATTIVDDQVLTKRSPQIPKSRAEISSKDAVKAAVDYLKVPFYPDIAPVKESYETDKGNIPHHSIFTIILTTICSTHATVTHLTVVDPGDIVSKEDVKREFTYTAIKLPDENPRNEFSTILSPENFQASPSGWTKGYRLTGNNVEVIAEGGRVFGTATRGVFKGFFDPTLPPQTPTNIVAGAINVFYVANTFHDTLYQYGFNEPAGNFQRDNFNRGGIGGDPVIINLQGSKRKNDASFNTPFDGRSGVLDLHIFTATEPNRDPALDNTVTVHELTHGLSNRLTGGAQTKICMSKTESLGLSEGYSDMMALIFTAKPKDTRNTRRVMGKYAEGDQRGSHRYPYTTDLDVNPLKYQDVVGEKQRHALGEIWAVMLFEVYWNFVEEYGFSANLHGATQKKR